jgi:4-amino-4-deoxy-L-arabinose transferase-like glycosyltransferase
MKDGNARGFVVAMTALSALVRLYGLGQQSFWSDEMHTVMMAGVPYGPEAPPWRPSDLLQVTQGPLFMGLVHAWSTLAGRGEALLRLLPALFAIATVPVFFKLGERTIGRRAAQWATLVLAVSPFHVWYAQELRGYSLAIGAAVAASLALALLLAREGGSVKQHVGYAASLAAGLGGSLTMGFLLPVHAILAAARAGAIGMRRGLTLVLTWVVIGLLASPWLGVFGTRHDIGRAVDRPAVDEPPLRGETTMPPLAIPYAFYAFAVGFSFGPAPAELHASPERAVRQHWPAIAVTALIFGGLLVLGLRYLWVARRPAFVALLVWLVVPCAIAGWMAAANIKVWNARYVAVSLPAFLLTLGAGLEALAPRRRTRTLALALVLGLSLAALWNLRHDPRYAKEDYRRAGAYLDRELAPDDLLIGIGAPQPIFYYARKRPGEYLFLNPHRIGNEAELRRRIEAASQVRSRVWLLRVRVHQGDPGNRVGAILGESRSRAVTEAFTGIELERYDRQARPAAMAPAAGPRPVPRGQPALASARLGPRPHERLQRNSFRPLAASPTCPSVVRSP